MHDAACQTGSQELHCSEIRSGWPTCRLVAEGMIDVALMTLESALRDMTRGMTMDRGIATPRASVRGEVRSKIFARKCLHASYQYTGRILAQS